AEIQRQKIEALNNYQSRSTVVNPRLNNLDVATIISDEAHAYVNYMMIANGSIIYARTIQVEKKLEEEDADILSLALDRLREKYQSSSNEVIVPMEVDVASENIIVTIPKAGDKKKLLDLSLKNAEVFRSEVTRKEKLLLGEASKQSSAHVLEELQEALQLPDLPEHIECFDNSN